MRIPTSNGRRGSRVGVALIGTSLSLTVVYTLSVLVRANGFSPFFDTWIYNGALLLASLTCLIGARHRGADRGVWMLAGAGCMLWAVSDCWWSAFVRPRHPMPYPSISDFLWLASYVPLAASMVVMMRRGHRELRLSLVLDAAVGGFTTAAIAAGLAFGPIAKASTGSVAAITTNLAYPSADLVLILLVVTAVGLRGWRLDLRISLVGLAFLAFAASDTFYLLRVAHGTYEQGTIWDCGWLVAIALIAVAAWLPERSSRPGHTNHWTAIALPVLFGGAALALLVSGAFHHLHALPVFLAAAALVLAGVRMVITFREVTALTRTKAEMRTKVFTDELTGLGNRRRLLDHLEDLAGQPDARFAVVAIDLDRFKNVNDTFGHLAGDELLGRVSKRLESVLRDGDVATRVGGDEFTLVLPDLDNEEAVGVALRVLEQLRTPVVLSVGTVVIDASIGVACAPDHGRSPTELLQMADAAMYVAKRDGTGVEVPRVDGLEDDLASRRLFQEFRRTGLVGELELYFQPKIALATGRANGAEALVRWRHPERGILPPSEFLPVCEGTALMRRVTAWVLDAAVAQIAMWGREGVEMPLAVNVSATDLQDHALPELAAAALARHHVSAHMLTLEITETTLISKPGRAAEVIRRLRALGVKISLDDFGTGFSSLSHLKDFPLSELKLDRQFVGALENAASEVIVRSITDMAHALGLCVVAEGVEDSRLAAQLASMGCDVAQGFYWSRPLPAGEFTDWLRDQTPGRSASTDVEPDSPHVVPAEPADIGAEPVPVS